MSPLSANCRAQSINASNSVNPNSAVILCSGAGRNEFQFGDHAKGSFGADEQ